MSSEIHQLTDLQRQILHLMMAGWQQPDMMNTAGMFELSELTDHFGIPVEEMRQQLEFLENLGYVTSYHSHGVDQTEVYKGLDLTPKGELDPANPTYFITEQGKNRVVADLASEGGATTETA